MKIGKCALSGLRQFLTIKNILHMVKNALYLALKALFVLKIIRFFSWFLGHVIKAA